jgi:hypothetical protein
VRTGRIHPGLSLQFADKSTAMKLPVVCGNPRGAAIDVVWLLVAASGRVSPVALSKSNHEAI